MLRKVEESKYWRQKSKNNESETRKDMGLINT